MANEKSATTFSLNTKLKKRFKLECTINEVEMSEVVELMMEDYCKLSISLREEREKKDH